jgi:hypothetical protein
VKRGAVENPKRTASALYVLREVMIPIGMLSGGWAISYASSNLLRAFAWGVLGVLLMARITWIYLEALRQKLYPPMRFIQFDGKIPYSLVSKRLAYETLSAILWMWIALYIAIIHRTPLR